MKSRKLFFIVALLIFLAFLFVLFFSKSEPKSENKDVQNLYNQAKEAYKKGNYSETIKIYNNIIIDYSDYKNIPYIYYDLFEIYKNQNKLLKAKKMLKAIINNFSNTDIIKNVQEELENLNMQILFSPVSTKYDIVYKVEKGDTLTGIAKKYNTTVDLIKRSNNLENDTIFPDMKLKIIDSEFSILVIKSQYMLTLKLGDEILKNYEISTGKGGYDSTPVGKFRITTKLIDPVWYKNGKAFPPQSPKNVLGSRWLGLSKKGYGIHGTTKPDTIGKPMTQGCIRMYNSDVEELYSIVPKGILVTIIE